MIETWFSQDLQNAVQVRTICGNVFSMDNNGNKIGVRVTNGGEPATLSGTISANVIRADGATVAVAGTISGNEAYVVLPQACYAVPGVITIVLKNTVDSNVTTLLAVMANVYQSSTDTAVDPGTIIPSIQALIAEIENTKATIPQDYSELSNAVITDAITNDLIETAVGNILRPIDSTGTVTTGKAWKADKTQVTGAQYKYVTYNISSGDIGKLAIIFGHGWGKAYPLACFYDSNMDLICLAGERGDTAYKGMPIVIPPATATIVINGWNSSTYDFGMYVTDLGKGVDIFGSVLPYTSTINSTLIGNVPSYANVKNLPANCIYNLGASAYESMTGLPEGLDTYATLVKLNGGKRTDGTYSTYICANESSVWIGFENSTNIAWHLIKGQQNRKYLLIGDSYGDGYSHDGNNSGWCTYFASEMGLAQTQYEARHQGGSGFGNGGLLARLNAATGSGFTDIIVLGGFNDYSYSAADIGAAISTFCARAKALFPSAKVHIGCVGWIKEGTGSSAYSNWEDVRDAITGTVLPAYQSCAKYGADYINFIEYILNDSMMTPTDGYHPGEAGNKAIAHGLVNATATGCACLPFKSVLKA